MQLDPGTLNRRVRIERPVVDDSFTGAGSGTWQLVAEVWAEVQDTLPSRGERMADGINVSTGSARVRMRFRTDVRSDMRLVMGSRVMQIVSGPAEMGWKDGLEFMVEAYSSAGNAA